MMQLASNGVRSGQLRGDKAELERKRAEATVAYDDLTTALAKERAEAQCARARVWRMRRIVHCMCDGAARRHACLPCTAARGAYAARQIAAAAKHCAPLRLPSTTLRADLRATRGRSPIVPRADAVRRPLPAVRTSPTFARECR